MIEDLVSRVFATRNAAHLKHWSTGSFAEHSALGDFYDDVIEKIDDIVETYQGAFGKIKKPTLSADAIADVPKHIGQEANWIMANRCKISRDVSALENKIDDLADLYLRTFYKLTNLK